MAMQLLDKESFEKELRKAGLKPTDHTTSAGRIWETDDGNIVMVPEIRGRVPDSVLDTVLIEVNKLYR